MSKEAVGEFLHRINEKEEVAAFQSEASSQADPVAWMVESAARQGFQFPAAGFQKFRRKYFQC
jgi:hypothetical protein